MKQARDRFVRTYKFASEEAAIKEWSAIDLKFDLLTDARLRILTWGGKDESVWVVSARELETRYRVSRYQIVRALKKHNGHDRPAIYPVYYKGNMPLYSESVIDEILKRRKSWK